MIIKTKDDFERFLRNVALACIQHNKCSVQCPFYDYCDGEFVSISLKSIKRICQNNDEVNNNDEQMTKQDAIETLEIFKNDYTRDGSTICKAIDIAIDVLKQTTVEPEQRHAYWEPNDVGEYHCTYCGVECDIDEFHKALLNPFCGNCGAYMREVNEDGKKD